MRALPAPLRVSVIIIGAVAIWLVTALVARSLFGEGYSYASHVLRALGTVALVALLLFGLLKWERVGANHYGLHATPQRLRLAGLGSAGYVIPWALAAAAVLALGAARLDVTSPVLLVGQALAVLTLVLLFEAIPEELIFRGYIFAALRERLPTWATVVVQAVLFCLFGVAIGAAEQPDRLLLFAAFSLALGVIRAVSGSVYATIGFHAAFQLISQLINGPQWSSVSAIDPDLWFRDVALFLVPLLCGPLLVWIVVRRLQRR